VRGVSETALPAAASVAFVRFTTAWCRVQNELANGTVFENSESIIPLAHQRYALERAMAVNDVRYMLVEKVGLERPLGRNLL
jgi:hypothetical protein